MVTLKKCVTIGKLGHSLKKNISQFEKQITDKKFHTYKNESHFKKMCHIGKNESHLKNVS